MRSAHYPSCAFSGSVDLAPARRVAREATVDRPCARCGQALHRGRLATWHANTGCVSCRPVIDPDGGYGEPEGFGSDPCATIADRLTW
jgi:hypothetical protein